MVLKLLLQTKNCAEKKTERKPENIKKSESEMR